MFPVAVHRKQGERVDDYLERVATEHHRALTRHARVVDAQARNLILLTKRVEQATPAKLIEDFEKLSSEVHELSGRVKSLRAVLLTVAVMLGGGYTAGKAIEKPTVVQVSPEAVNALRDMIK